VNLKRRLPSQGYAGQHQRSVGLEVGQDRPLQRRVLEPIDADLDELPRNCTRP